MRLKLIKAIAYLTIIMVIVGTVSQAAAYKKTCPPGKCCCASNMQAPEMPHHQGPHRISKKCDEQAPCCHLNANPLVKDLLNIAIISNLSPLGKIMASGPGAQPIVSDTFNRLHSASSEVAIPAATLPIYLQFLSIIC